MKGCFTPLVTRLRQARQDLLREQAEGLVAERRGQEVVEADLLAQLRDLIEHRVDGAVHNDLVEIALHAIDARRVRIGDADGIVLRAEIGIDDPLRAGPRRLARLLGIVAERHEPGDRQFAPRGRMPGFL